MLLQLYNNAWLHHELCSEMFNPRSRQRLFGSYLHSISAHAALQYEIVCLKSVSAENQERLFGQARRIATATSNRQPENVISNVLLRLQAKQGSGHLTQSLSKSESQVTKAAA